MILARAVFLFLATTGLSFGLGSGPHPQLHPEPPAMQKALDTDAAAHSFTWNILGLSLLASAAFAGAVAWKLGARRSA